MTGTAAGARGGVEALTLGEALVAVLPSAPVAIDAGEALRLAVGGAELNLAVGLARLGVRVAWVGYVGDDPLGRLVVRTLRREGVDSRWVGLDPARPTALYLREWLPGGQRRSYYYRAGSAAASLHAGSWPTGAAGARWVHVTGITVALGPGPAGAVRSAVAWAREHGLTVSFDPDYRPQRWDPETARNALVPIVQACHVLLLSTEDAELLFGTADPEAVLARARECGPACVVLKRGEQGAVAAEGDLVMGSPAEPAEPVVDPVGAGDGFDAGFIAGRLRGADLSSCLALGAYVGARAVEQVGEHAGYPTLAELPRWLRVLLTP